MNKFDRHEICEGGSSFTYEHVYSFNYIQCTIVYWILRQLRLGLIKDDKHDKAFPIQKE